MLVAAAINRMSEMSGVISGDILRGNEEEGEDIWELDSLGGPANKEVSLEARRILGYAFLHQTSRLAKRGELLQKFKARIDRVDGGDGANAPRLTAYSQKQLVARAKRVLAAQSALVELSILVWSDILDWEMEELSIGAGRRNRQEPGFVPEWCGLASAFLLGERGGNGGEIRPRIEGYRPAMVVRRLQDDGVIDVIAISILDHATAMFASCRVTSDIPFTRSGEDQDTVCRRAILLAMGRLCVLPSPTEVESMCKDPSSDWACLAIIDKLIDHYVEIKRKRRPADDVTATFVSTEEVYGLMYAASFE